MRLERVFVNAPLEKLPEKELEVAVYALVAPYTKPSWVTTPVPVLVMLPESSAPLEVMLVTLGEVVTLGGMATKRLMPKVG